MFSLLFFQTRIRVSCQSEWRKKFSSFHITTPIFYVNAAPHMGHLYSVVIADATVRFQVLKEKYSDDSIIFGTGTDEHGSKIQKAAESFNTPPKEYCDRISEKYKSLFALFDIRYSNFIRTTDAKHKTAVQHFWNLLKERGNISPGNYTGWYCPADESFLTDLQLKTVVQPDKTEIKVSAESGRPVEWTEEKNFNFNLGKYLSDLEHWLKTDRPVQPVKFYNQLCNWVSVLKDENFSNLSISRPASRVHWGIPVPDHSDQIVYVWLDALINYLTTVGYPDNLTNWPPDVQVIGKDILKFHGIYWPAFLIAAGLEPPRILHVHSHWTVNNQKMSKSLGNVIDPFEKVKTYGASGFRYFLLREGTAHSDANYSETKVLRMLNAELADTLGNLLNRCTGSVINSWQTFPAFEAEEFEKLFHKNNNLKNLISRIENLQSEVNCHYEELNFYKGIEYIILTVHEINKFFEHSQPWNLRKDPQKYDELRSVLHVTMESLRICGIALMPITPRLSSILLDKLSVEKSKRYWRFLIPSWKAKDLNSDVKLYGDKVVLYQRIK